MRITGLFPSLLVVLLAGCAGDSSFQGDGGISADLFRHHYITTDAPVDIASGHGVSTLADFDGDGDLDYTFALRGDSVYWMEYVDGNWRRHAVGALRTGQLGGAATDVDGDGHPDVVIGGIWYRNTGEPRTQSFEPYVYDSRVDTEIHDLVVADVDGDGRDDLVALGDKEGAFWYEVPQDPMRDADWPRTPITMQVLDEEDDIHGGFFPGGVADLDGDADADVVMPDRWFENAGEGESWTQHDLPFGSRGPWGLSARSWIVDLDGDGDQDIVIVDNDQSGTSAAWLENEGGAEPSFTKHLLPFTAPGEARGSFHSLAVADFDADGDDDIFAAEQEDPSIQPEPAGPRWYIWENVGGTPPQFEERVILDAGLGAHDARIGDIDGDGDIDIASKIWRRWPENANEGRFHADWLENLLVNGSR